MKKHPNEIEYRIWYFGVPERHGAGTNYTCTQINLHNSLKKIIDKGYKVASISCLDK